MQHVTEIIRWLLLCSIAKHVTTKDWPCECVGGAATDLRGIQVAKVKTFDGLVLKLTKDQKTLAARSLPSPDIPQECIFKLAVESDARFKHPMIRIDWVALGIGHNPRSGDIYRRNFQFGLDQVYRRGKGIEKMGCTLPYRFKKQGTVVDIKQAHKNSTHAVFSLTSPTCNIQLDYFQNLKTFRDTFALRVGKEYASNMEGFCGTCDGIAANDKTMWHSNRTIKNGDDNVYGKITGSYAYGEHQHAKQARLMHMTGIHLGDPWDRIIHRIDMYHRKERRAKRKGQSIPTL